MYKLQRILDGSGCEGTISKAIGWKTDGTFDLIMADKPTIGCSMLVGNNEENSWLTTVVVKIIEEKEDYIKFKTKHSLYEWYKYKS